MPNEYSMILINYLLLKSILFFHQILNKFSSEIIIINFLKL